MPVLLQLIELTVAVDHLLEEEDVQLRLGRVVHQLVNLTVVAGVGGEDLKKMILETGK